MLLDSCVDIISEALKDVLDVHGITVAKRNSVVKRSQKGVLLTQNCGGGLAGLTNSCQSVSVYEEILLTVHSHSFIDEVEAHIDKVNVFLTKCYKEPVDLGMNRTFCCVSQ
ncbi:hypothetical protein GF342_01595 [Candidatus Woesearchaeota archaeon]|nr:hypothetical protein [Candidatus Woesearchaeota archaeon]